MKKAMTCLAAIGIAGTAMAQVDGDIVFTDNLTDSIRWIDGANSSAGLVTYAPDSDFRLGGLIRVGGSYFVANGPSSNDVVPPSQILRVDDLFGSPVTTTLASGQPLANPIGLAYDAANNQILAANNISGGAPAGYIRGIAGLDLGTNVVSEIAAATGPGAVGTNEFSLPIRITKEQTRDSFVVSDASGSAFSGSETLRGSALWRLSDVTSNSSNLDLIVDLGDTSVTGLSTGLDEIRGVVSVGNSLFITEARSADAIFRVDLDGNGDFVSITEIASGFDAAQEIVYNQYTNKLVFSDSIAQTIYQMDLNGDNLEALLTGVNARGIAIVPTPGGVALLGLGGLLAARRRRG